MNRFNSPAPEVEIDLIDMFWKLLMQWKAILIVCIITALMASGAKYLMDSAAYTAFTEEQKKTEAEASRPQDERIAEVLGKLPTSEKSMVLLVLQQEDMIELQQDYLNNSIGLNLDPANQRTLTIKYLLRSDAEADMQTLTDAYGTCIRRKEYMEKLGDIIDPGAKAEYIGELISTSNSPVPDSYAKSTIFTVSVIQPEDTDPDKIVSLMDSAIKDLHKEISSEAGEHSIKRENIEDGRSYNTDLISRRSSIINSINDLNNRIQNTKNSFSEEQKEAMNEIERIRDPKAEADEGSIVAEPVISKKYAMLGFMLGAFLYALIYIAVTVLRRSVTSASSVQSLTGTRLLGEIYTMTEHKGMRRLLSSERIINLRYREKLDTDAQSASAADTIGSVSAYNKADRLTFLLTSKGGGVTQAAELLKSKCLEAGSIPEVTTLYIAAMKEKDLASVHDAVYIVTENTRIDDLMKLNDLCSDYDIRLLGSVYISEL